jgi:hypothetical protein
MGGQSVTNHDVDEKGSFISRGSTQMVVALHPFERQLKLL